MLSPPNFPITPWSNPGYPPNPSPPPVVEGGPAPRGPLGVGDVPPFAYPPPISNPFWRLQGGGGGYPGANRLPPGWGPSGGFFQSGPLENLAKLARLSRPDFNQR